MKKVTFLFINSGFYHCKSNQENTKNANFAFFGFSQNEKSTKYRQNKAESGIEMKFARTIPVRENAIFWSQKTNQPIPLKPTDSNPF